MVYKPVQYTLDGLWYATYWDGYTRVKASEGFLFECDAEDKCFQLEREITGKEELK